MTRTIDLLPNSYRRRLGVQRLRAGYLKAAFALALINGGMYIHARQGIGQRQAKANELAAKVAELDEIRAQTKTRTQVATDLQSRLNDYNSLAIPVQPSDVVQLVSQSLVANLVLTDLQMHVIQRRRTTSAMEKLRQQTNRTKRGKNEPVEVDRILNVEVSGLGQQAVHVAQLIGNLESNPAFQSVQLEYDRVRVIDEIPYREFCVRLELDLEAQFVVNATDSTTDPALRANGGAVLTQVDDGGSQP